MSKEKFRARNFALLLYPEDKSHVQAIEKIKQNYDYAMINHDKDLDDTGNIKKIHTHVVIKLANAQWNTAIAKELEITENYLQQIRNFENALEYMIHWNEPEKYQYPIENVTGTLKKKLIQYIENDEKTESDKVFELIEFITGMERKLTITEFAKYCATKDRWDIFRRSAAIFIKIIEEHNNFYQT